MHSAGVRTIQLFKEDHVAAAYAGPHPTTFLCDQVPFQAHNLLRLCPDNTPGHDQPKTLSSPHHKLLTCKSHSIALGTKVITEAGWGTLL